MGRCWLVLGGTGAVLGGTGWFVVVMGQYGAVLAYLIFVIFFTLENFLENKIYTEKRQFFALNL